jgi:outer membrane biosynthesis protein TonB
MARAEIRSLRPGRLVTSPLVAALLLSLLLHLGGGAVYELGKKFGWWKKLSDTSLVKKFQKKNPPTTIAKKDDEPPLIFVDVSHAETDAPKKAKYYSNKNSRAANPDAEQNSNQPKLDGAQTEMPKTENVPELPKLQPSAQPQQPTPETKPQPPAEKSDPMNMGDHELKKISETPAQQQSPQQPQRPRTLKQALAQQQLPGQQMRQDGGVHRKLQWSSLDVKSTAFGDYDRAIVDAVTSHWYNLLDSHRFAEDRTGKVIVHFKLRPDGSITEVEILVNTVGQLLGYVCEEAVQEAAPFGKWPDDMRREIGANYRDISFTFYYY